MKKLMFALLTITCGSTGVIAENIETTSKPEIHSEKPVQHLKVADVTSLEQAKAIFKKTTADIQSRTQLSPEQLHEIHLITYSLEKSVAFLQEHFDGNEQLLAQEIAIVVESIHLASENNRKEETQNQIEKYMSMADQLIANF